MVVAELESPGMQELDVAKIRDLRKAKGLTQAQIAERAGMSLPRWNDVETGRRPNVTIETLTTIAAVLGVDARDLITPAKGKKKG